MTSEKDMENLDEKEKFDDDLIRTETLHDIRDRNQTNPKINKREARMGLISVTKHKRVFAESSWEYHSTKKDTWSTYPVLES